MRIETEWNESQMATGFPEIDGQHKEWISRFNKFTAAVTSQKGEEAWTDALMFFIHYTETHFRFEESIMKIYRCSTEAMNKAEHEKFQARIQEITYMTWPLGATMDDVINLQKELADWLRHHICTIDVQLRDVAPGRGSEKS